MNIIRIFVILAVLYSLVSTLDSWVEQAEYPVIDSWGVWADVGCSEESRMKGSSFDKVCSDWEQSQQAQELTDASVGCYEDCLDDQPTFSYNRPY